VKTDSEDLPFALHPFSLCTNERCHGAGKSVKDFLEDSAGARLGRSEVILAGASGLSQAGQDKRASTWSASGLPAQWIGNVRSAILREGG